MQTGPTVKIQVDENPLMHANLLGEIQNIAEIETIRELLFQLGIIANYVPEHRAKSAIYQSADINIFHSPASEVQAKRRFQVRFFKPYLTVSFFGPSETAGALRDIGEALNISTGKVEKIIRNGLIEVTESINYFSDGVFGKRILVIHEGYQGAIISALLKDLGVKVSRVKAQHYNRPEQLKVLMKEKQGELIIGPYDPSIETFHGVPYLSVPDHENCYLGFSGFTNLAKRISELSCRAIVRGLNGLQNI